MDADRSFGRKGDSIRASDCYYLTPLNTEAEWNIDSVGIHPVIQFWGYKTTNKIGTKTMNYDSCRILKKDRFE